MLCKCVSNHARLLHLIQGVGTTAQRRNKLYSNFLPFITVVRIVDGLVIRDMNGLVFRYVDGLVIRYVDGRISIRYVVGWISLEIYGGFSFRYVYGLVVRYVDGLVVIYVEGFNH